MFCKSCGKQIDDDSIFCSFCGTKQPEIQKTIIKAPENLPTEPQIVEIKTKIKENISTPAQATDLFSDIKIQPDDNKLTFQKIIGSFLCILGFFLLSSYFSFLILKTHSIRIPNIYMYKFYGTIFITPAFGIHFWALCGIILLLGSFVFRKKEPIAFKKTFAFIIDGALLILALFFIQAIFNGEHSFKVDDSIGSNSGNSFSSWLDTYDIYKTRVIVCSLFFILYYFIGQLTEGTFGQKILKIKSVSFSEQKVSLKQVMLKTLYYGLATWAILIYLLSLGKNFPFYTKSPPYLTFEDNSIFQVFLWLNFIFVFVSALTMLFNKQNRSMAEIISNTKTIIKHTGDIKLKETKPISDSETTVTTHSHSQIEIPAYEEAQLFDLHKLVDKERRKLVSGENSKITDSLKSLISNGEDFVRLNEVYKLHFNKTIIEHLISISSAYSTINYYVTPLVELGICGKVFPHKIL